VARVPKISGIAEMSHIPPTPPSFVTWTSTITVTGYGDFAAIVFGFEFPHRWFVADQKYLDREFRKFGIAKYQRADELVEMFEFSQDTLGAVFARGRFHDIGFGADLNPGKE